MKAKADESGEAVLFLQEKRIKITAMSSPGIQKEQCLEAFCPDILHDNLIQGTCSCSIFRYLLCNNLESILSYFFIWYLLQNAYLWTLFYISGVF